MKTPNIKLTVQTITIGNTSYVVPSSVKLADLLAVSNLLPIRSVYSQNPWKSFEYIEHDGMLLSIGTRTVFDSEESAEDAKKAYMRAAELARETEGSSE
jgi:hypothetical protein